MIILYVSHVYRGNPHFCVKIRFLDYNRAISVVKVLIGQDTICCGAKKDIREKIA
jgi:hypothetical protein